MRDYSPHTPALPPAAGAPMKLNRRPLSASATTFALGLLVLISGCDPTQDPATAATQFATDLLTFFQDFARQLLAAFLF